MKRVWVILNGESESGMIKRRFAVPLDEIDAVEEESVPIKMKSRCRVHTEFRSFTTSSTFDEVMEMIRRGSIQNGEDEGNARENH